MTVRQNENKTDLLRKNVVYLNRSIKCLSGSTRRLQTTKYDALIVYRQRRLKTFVLMCGSALQIPDPIVDL